MDLNPRSCAPLRLAKNLGQFCRGVATPFRGTATEPQPEGRMPGPRQSGLYPERERRNEIVHLFPAFVEAVEPQGQLVFALPPSLEFLIGENRLAEKLRAVGFQILMEH